MAARAAAAPVTAPATDHMSSRPVACLHCRQRRSYCSKEKPSCSRCRDGGLACVYEGARKILVNESYLRQLEAKAKAFDAAQSSEASGDGGRDQGAALDGDEDFGDEQPLLEPFTQLSLDRPLTSFQGPASSDNFLRNARKLSGRYGAAAAADNDDAGLDDANLYEPDALPSRRHTYMYIGTIFAFTDPADSFERLLAAAYHAGAPDLRDRDGCLAYAKLLLVLAFGQLYSVNQWVGFRGPPGFDYFTDALSLLPESHEAGSILGVETLALAGYFMQNMNRRDAAFQYVGRALRMAISLGLHQEVSPGAATAAGAGADEAAAREHRRRVWWSVYSLDRILCAKSGNPLTIQDDDIGVDQPAPLAGADDAASCPAVMLRHYTQLSRILGRIHTTIYRRAAPRSGRSLMASVQSIVLALSRWHRELPDRLRFEPARLRFSRESVGALAHYFFCINMTVRPLFFHIVQRRLRAVRAAGPGARQRDWREGLSHTTARVIDMCVGAAQDTVNMMVIASQRDMVATYGYMDGEHIFSATIVLVMVCAAFPTTPANSLAMNAGLSLLRSMGERGNSHMGARHELLVHLHASLADHDDQHHRHDGNKTPTSTNDNNDNTTQGAHHQHRASSLPFPQTAMPPQHQGQIIGSVINPPGPDGVSEALATFPAVDSSALDEPFYDESATTGMDFGLWEEGFACPTMDLDGAGSVHLSDFIHSHDV
ncbi:fungal specific transcription factor domain-containing protein [Hirsutella rhossiliensis]|uniref:Fungal specific transcription factor domain-containing protein n=1 Tax=Hirsutella rhossiliensis TaxID=111463 RepID=A0A9P8SJ84_9HYPO|nr:fungal specific transcription factor domain-containing protein [Hirsutella rhossiliensis]KAH0964621.1 fungal specific transcription factor domain-containing protein [Hirsutella rhossiliensis]